MLTLTFFNPISAKSTLFSTDNLQKIETCDYIYYEWYKNSTKKGYVHLQGHSQGMLKGLEHPFVYATVSGTQPVNISSTASGGFGGSVPFPFIDKQHL